MNKTFIKNLLDDGKELNHILIDNRQYDFIFDAELFYDLVKLKWKFWRKFDNIGLVVPDNIVVEQYSDLLEVRILPIQMKIICLMNHQP